MLTSGQKHLVFTLLLMAFVARIAVGVFAEMRYVQVFSKNVLNDKTEKEDAAEEKIKVPDAVIPTHAALLYPYHQTIKSNIFSQAFNLVVCHLPVKIQPPKMPA